LHGLAARLLFPSDYPLIPCVVNLLPLFETGRSARIKIRIDNDLSLNFSFSLR